MLLKLSYSWLMLYNTYFCSAKECSEEYLNKGRNFPKSFFRQELFSPTIIKEKKFHYSLTHFYKTVFHPKNIIC